MTEDREVIALVICLATGVSMRAINDMTYFQGEVVDIFASQIQRRVCEICSASGEQYTIYTVKHMLQFCARGVVAMVRVKG